MGKFTTAICDEEKDLGGVLPLLFFQIVANSLICRVPFLRLIKYYVLFIIHIYVV